MDNDERLKVCLCLRDVTGNKSMDDYMNRVRCLNILGGGGGGGEE